MLPQFGDGPCIKVKTMRNLDSFQDSTLYCCRAAASANVARCDHTFVRMEMGNSKRDTAELTQAKSVRGAESKAML